MSADFEEVVLGCYEAFAKGDRDFLTAHTDPEIEIVEASTPTGGRTYRGHDGLLAAIDNWADQWDDFEIEIERVIEAGSKRVILMTRHSGRGKLSGAEVELHNVNVHTGRDGKVTRWEMFSTLDDAFAAIGLRKLRGET
jgi:ketosteroid isomerase-like protein